MKSYDQYIDQVDMDLYRLADTAGRLFEVKKDPKMAELARMIRKARSQSFSLLPKKRQDELTAL